MLFHLVYFVPNQYVIIIILIMFIVFIDIVVLFIFK